MNTKTRRRGHKAGSIADGLRSLAGHLYREARSIEPGEKNAYADGLREAALIASRRASMFDTDSPRVVKKRRGAKKR